jgi:uncharacterized membrane protein YozB (DUF420 family)
MSLPFDPGDASLAFQVVVFFLLVLGLPFVKGIGTKKNFMIHGRLTFLALMLHAILIFIAMVPSLGGGSGGVTGLSFLYASIFWSHVILGTAALILGFTIIGFWVYKPLSNMECMRVKKVMAPLLIIWAISLINGSLVHILKII